MKTRLIFIFVGFETVDNFLLFLTQLAIFAFKELEFNPIWIFIVQHFSNYHSGPILK